MSSIVQQTTDLSWVLGCLFVVLVVIVLVVIWRVINNVLGGMVKKEKYQKDRQETIDKISSTNWQQLPDETLKQIAGIIKGE